ncbi:hypothetical protein O0Q50_28485 [Priestia aryabhattai]|uniref:O-antigen polymerase n=1 Tax=Priestia aryabhattai TaxID=412384 RepID=A0AAX6NH52_PRIAR|nr:hypothetical protein [Priestia aryabhattai]MDU9695139.1 hypothetical protein [Priestia aryabhattai]
MKKNKKSISFVLLIFLVLPQLNLISFHPFFLMVCLYLAYNFVFYRVPISKKIFRRAIVLGLLLVTAIASFLYSFSNPMADAIRDSIYLIYPILMLIIGYIQMLKFKDVKVILKTIIVAAVILSLIHLGKLIINPTVLSGTIRDIRLALGNGYTLTVIALGIMIYSKRYNLDIIKKRSTKFWFILLCLSSLVLSLSRTLPIMLAIFVICLGWRSLPKRTKIRLYKRNIHLKISVSIFALLLFGLIMIPVSQTSAYSQLSDKFLNSLSEVHIEEYRTIQDINHNWRGYEAYRALIEYDNFDPVQKVIGGGLGKLVDLNMTIMLAGKVYREVPIIHNGYMYILVKTGALGIILYLYFLFTVVKDGFNFQRNALKKNDKLLGRLMISAGISVLITTYINTGMYKPESAYEYLLLIGSLYGYLHLEKQKQHQTNNEVGENETNIA